MKIVVPIRMDGDRLVCSNYEKIVALFNLECKIYSELLEKKLNRSMEKTVEFRAKRETGLQHNK